MAFDGSKLWLRTSDQRTGKQKRDKAKIYIFMADFSAEDTSIKAVYRCDKSAKGLNT